jgi:hypothetical protein
VAVPNFVVTAIIPDRAAFGTVAMICVVEGTVKATLIPEIFTDRAPRRFTPRIVTRAPGLTLIGVTLLINGLAPELTPLGAVDEVPPVGSTTNAVAELTVPPGVVTVTVPGPVVTSGGTTTVIWVPAAFATWLDAATPLN